MDETELDRLIYGKLMQIKENADKNYRTIEADVKKWLAKKYIMVKLPKRHLKCEKANGNLSFIHNLIGDLHLADA